jgi:hypothetical protein
MAAAVEETICAKGRLEDALCGRSLLEEDFTSLGMTSGATSAAAIFECEVASSIFSLPNGCAVEGLSSLLPACF